MASGLWKGDTQMIVQETAARYGGRASSELVIDGADRDVLRVLANQVAELAARPVEQEKRGLWYRHNGLEHTRPLVFCDPENSWHEIIPSEKLKCEGILAREWEFQLRREVFWGAEMRDDRVIEACFDVPHVYAESDWGMAPVKTGGHDGGSYIWDSPIKRYSQLDDLRFPQITVDTPATERKLDLANDVLGDLLEVRLKTQWWWTLGMTWTLVDLRGLAQIMYDMVDHPDELHRLMTFLRDGHLAKLDYLEHNGLLSLNTGGSYVGSGGFGWTHELPRPGFEGVVRTCDIWGFAESQETVGVSPRMFGEFVFPYQVPLLERFGLNCYGCCEPLDKRWQYVEQIPNLRRVSVSPWADRAKMADLLGDRYVYSLKPRPTDLAMDSFDEGRIRSILREDLRVVRDCIVEVIMKDTHTIQGDPWRVIRWVQIAREEAEAL